MPLLGLLRQRDARIEVELDAEDEREGKSYGARLRLSDRVSEAIELDFREVADSRGSLAWCAEKAETTRARARDLAAGRGALDAPAR
jgi:hypothetical protein